MHCRDVGTTWTQDYREIDLLTSWIQCEWYHSRRDKHLNSTISSYWKIEALSRSSMRSMRHCEDERDDSQSYKGWLDELQPSKLLPK